MKGLEFYHIDGGCVLLALVSGRIEVSVMDSGVAVRQRGRVCVNP